MTEETSKGSNKKFNCAPNTTKQSKANPQLIYKVEKYTPKKLTSNIHFNELNNNAVNLNSSSKLVSFDLNSSSSNTLFDNQSQIKESSTAEVYNKKVLSKRNLI